MKKETTYHAFYTSRLFWVETKVDTTDKQVLDNFTEIMSEQVFTYGDESYSLVICRDGLIMLNVSNLEQNIDNKHTRMDRIISRRSEYLEYINVLYLLLDSSLSKIMSMNYFDLVPVTTMNVIQISFKDGKFSSAVGGQHGNNYNFMARFLSQFIPNIPISLDSRMNRLGEIKKDVFDQLDSDFKFIVDKTILRKRLSLISKSIGEFKIGNYDFSLVLAWFTIEAVLREKWNKYIDEKNLNYEDGSKRINTKRRRQLLKGIEYTANSISNILELEEKISFNLYERIREIRGKRNKLVHSENYICTAKDCRQAILTAFEMITEKQSIEINPNLTYGVTGI